MSRRVKVPMFQTARPIEIDADATEGAILGVNLIWPDGSVVSQEDLAPDQGDVVFPITAWRRLMEIPPNVTALAEQTGAGLYVITGPGSSEVRTIELAPGELTGSFLDGVGGNPSFGLADVPDVGGGLLQRTVFDAKGRKTGTSAATTDDLDEGVVNLYYTDERAQDAVGASIAAGTGDGVTLSYDDAGNAIDAVNTDKGGVAVAAHVAAPDPHPQYLTPAEGAAAYDAAGSAAAAQAFSRQRPNHTGTQVASTISNFAVTVLATVLTGLSTATNAAITAADTVLVALGKLQAQISGLITQTITNGDTTHAPSGGAVFDALAGKVSKSGDTLMGNLFGGFDGFSFRQGTSAGGDDRSIALSSSSGLSVARGAFLIMHGSEHPSSPGGVLLTAGVGGALTLTAPVGSSVRPGNDNSISSGTGSLRWSTVYAGTGTINTSDAREKDNIRELTPAELSAAQELSAAGRIYQWKAALAEKGEAARLHCSPTVQGVIAIMESHGLDPFRYGFVCYDEWDEQPEIRDEETGEVTQEYRPAGDRYSLRPTELAHFIMAGVVARQDDIETRLASIESFQESK